MIDIDKQEKAIVDAEKHLEDAEVTLDRLRWEEIGEECARLCADTAIMLAIFQLEDMRRDLRRGYDW